MMNILIFSLWDQISKGKNRLFDYKRILAYMEKILSLTNNHFPEDLIALESSFTRNYGIKEETPKE